MTTKDDTERVMCRTPKYIVSNTVDKLNVTNASVLVPLATEQEGGLTLLQDGKDQNEKVFFFWCILIQVE